MDNYISPSVRTWTWCDPDFCSDPRNEFFEAVLHSKLCGNCWVKVYLFYSQFPWWAVGLAHLVSFLAFHLYQGGMIGLCVYAPCREVKILTLSLTIIFQFCVILKYTLLSIEVYSVEYRSVLCSGQYYSVGYQIIVTATFSSLSAFHTEVGLFCVECGTTLSMEVYSVEYQRFVLLSKFTLMNIKVYFFEFQSVSKNTLLSIKVYFVEFRSISKKLSIGEYFVDYQSVSRYTLVSFKVYLAKYKNYTLLSIKV